MTPLQQYFRSLGDIRATGAAVPETSYYGALEALLNNIGNTLKPKVRCVMQLKQQGALFMHLGKMAENLLKRGFSARLRRTVSGSIRCNLPP